MPSIVATTRSNSCDATYAKADSVGPKFHVPCPKSVQTWNLELGTWNYSNSTR